MDSNTAMVLVVLIIAAAYVLNTKIKTNSKEDDKDTGQS